MPGPSRRGGGGARGGQAAHGLQEEGSPESPSGVSGIHFRRGNEKAPFLGWGERESRCDRDRPGATTAHELKFLAARTQPARLCR